ncbi:MAG: hypothetical protein JWO80_6158 [Bryobacterales bacterium]|nr:hypothetical protein [Bryobacterales bacterium]
MKHSLLPFVLAAVFGLSNCSEPIKTKPAETEAKKEPAGPPQPVTAKTAFWAIYKPARAWATDLQPVSVTSGEVPGIKNEAGKAGLWTIVFVSPTLHQARTYYYSVADGLPVVVKGIKLVRTAPWSGPTADVVPIQTSEFSIDSDAAYNTASAKAGNWIKKHPDKQVSFVLGNASRFPSPVWYVLWGTTKSGFEVFVNATQGTVFK